MRKFIKNYLSNNNPTPTQQFVFSVVVLVFCRIIIHFAPQFRTIPFFGNFAIMLSWSIAATAVLLIIFSIIRILIERKEGKEEKEEKSKTSACSTTDIRTNESVCNINTDNLIEMYRPQLRNGYEAKYSVEHDGLLASIGGIFGDIAGSRYEFFCGDRSNITFENAISKYSRITDDSVLLLATLVATNPSNKTSYTEAYRDFYHKYPMAGYGSGFVKWALEETGPYGSFGNGSAMRVAPIGELFDNVDDVIRHAIASAECTHNHPEGIKGAVVTAVCIWMVRYGYSKNDILSYVKKRYATQNFIKKYRMEELQNCIQGSYGVTCQFSVPAAITCFIESNNYEDCIVNALSFEGDSDTIACISGAIAAAYYGYLPENVRSIVSEKLPTELNNLLLQK